MSPETLNSVYAAVSIVLALSSVYIVFKLGKTTESVDFLIELAAQAAAKTPTKVDDRIVEAVKSLLASRGENPPSGS